MGGQIIILFAIFCIIVYTIFVQSKTETFEVEEWEEATMLYELSTQESLAIIDDAECHGFEVKRIGTKIYFREIP